MFYGNCKSILTEICNTKATHFMPFLWYISNILLLFYICHKASFPKISSVITCLHMLPKQLISFIIQAKILKGSVFKLQNRQICWLKWQRETGLLSFPLFGSEFCDISCILSQLFKSFQVFCHSLISTSHLGFISWLCYFNNHYNNHFLDLIILDAGQ